VRDCRLHTDSHETIGIIEWSPRMADQLAGNAVAADSIPGVQFGATVHQELNDFVSSFVCCTVQRRAPVAVHGVNAGAEFQE